MTTIIAAEKAVFGVQLSRLSEETATPSSSSTNKNDAGVGSLLIYPRRFLIVILLTSCMHVWFTIISN